MAFQAIPNAARVTIKAALSGEEVANTLCFGLVAPGVVSASQISALAADVAGVWVAEMLPTLPAEYVMGVVTVQVLDVQDGPVAESATGVGEPGGLVGDVLPNNNTFVVSFKTGLGGATNRGRNYVSGILKSEVTSSYLSNTRAQVLRSAYGTFVGAGAVSAGWQWCVASRKELVPGGPGRAVPVTSVTLSDLRVDSQRRRLPN